MDGCDIICIKSTQSALGQPPPPDLVQTLAGYEPRWLITVMLTGVSPLLESVKGTFRGAEPLLLCSDWSWGGGGVGALMQQPLHSPLDENPEAQSHGAAVGVCGGASNIH